jgi:hypothetical protein
VKSNNASLISPMARADFEHWSKAAHWTLEEAIALSFGRAPERVSWEKIKPYVQSSPFAFEYQVPRMFSVVRFTT